MKRAGGFFKLHAKGEENGDIWTGFALDGKWQLRRAQIILPEIDPKGWT